MAWVWGVARNHLRGLLREIAKRDDVASVRTKYETQHARRHHIAVLSSERRADLLAEVLGLPETDYQLLFHLFVERKDAAEVAEILGLSSATVRQRKRRLVAYLEAVNRLEASSKSKSPGNNHIHLKQKARL